MCTAERLHRRGHDREKIANCLACQSESLRESGRLTEAWEAARRCELVSRELNNRVDVAMGLGEEAFVLIKLADTKEALATLDRMERICRENRDAAGLLRCAAVLSVALVSRAEWGVLHDRLAGMEQECTSWARHEEEANLKLLRAHLLAQKLSRPAEADRVLGDLQRLAIEHHLPELMTSAEALRSALRAAPEVARTAALAPWIGGALLIAGVVCCWRLHWGWLLGVPLTVLGLLTLLAAFVGGALSQAGTAIENPYKPAAAPNDSHGPPPGR